MEEGKSKACKILKNCPKCNKLLEFKQINLDTALLFCIDVYCPYPITGECIIIKRKLKDMHKPINWTKQDKPDDFDKELEEYLKKEEQASTHQTQINQQSKQNSQTLTPTNDDWFDELLKDII